MTWKLRGAIVLGVAAIGAVLARAFGGVSGAILIPFGFLGGAVVGSTAISMFQQLSNRMRAPEGGAATARCPRSRYGDTAPAGLAGQDPEIEGEDLSLLVPDQLAQLPGRLMPGESVVRLAAATSSGHPGLFVATDRRVQFLPQAEADVSQELAFGEIRSIALVEKGVLTKLEISVGGGTRSFEIATESCRHIAPYLQHQMEEHRGNPAPR